jgi:hypothetical protein
MVEWVRPLVERLAQTRLPDVFNPYADRCPFHDKQDAPAIRRDNLLRVLERQVEVRTRTIWVGRDFGHRGARRTGISLTDEGHLDCLSSALRLTELPLATNTSPISERTATVTWGLIRRLSTPPVLWNAFPLHPHLPSSPLTNRNHSSVERLETAWSLRALIEGLRPSSVIAIGNDASMALTDMGVTHQKVRHPSYGGQADFVAGMEAIYGLASQKPRQLELI